MDKTGTDKLFPGLPEDVNGGGKAPDRVATPSSCAMTSREHPRMPAGGDQAVGDVEGASGDQNVPGRSAGRGLFTKHGDEVLASNAAHRFPCDPGVAHV